MLDKTSSLLSWCDINDVLIDSRIRIVYDAFSGITVRNIGDSYISPGTTLVKIPKDAVLSVKSSHLDAAITAVPYGTGAQLTLSLALYFELLKRNSSRWHGYLQSLPDTIVDLPIFWECQGSDTNDLRKKDSQEALTWMRGTELEKLLRHDGNNDSISLDQLDQYFDDVAQPLLCQNFGSGSSTLAVEGFYRAYSLVSSRAFLVDAYHGLSMVPIADAFNHVVENHVHLEVCPRPIYSPAIDPQATKQSDYHVCPECGSLTECPHDCDESVASVSVAHRKAASRGNDYDSLYEMVSNSVIPPQQEVFNTYGEKLANAQLLAQYGFILDVNENDCLTWTVEEVIRALDFDSNNAEFILSLLKQALDHPSLRRLLNMFPDSNLVYPNAESGLCLNADGKLSHQLWVLLLLLCCHRTASTTDVSDTLETVLALQIQLETQEDTRERNVDEALEDTLGDSAAGILIQMGRLIIDLCTSRKNKIGKVESNEQDLGEILDDLPDTMARTRMVVSLVMSEKSILDSCEAAWTDVITAIEFA